MKTKIKKWGNSLGLRIPKAFAQEAAVAEGSTVNLEIAGGKIVVTPVSRVGLALADLLAGVMPENLHDAMDTGPPRGREAW